MTEDPWLAAWSKLKTLVDSGASQEEITVYAAELGAALPQDSHVARAQAMQYVITDILTPLENTVDKTDLYSIDTSSLTWIVSSRSHDDDPPDNCVEVAHLPGGAVALRDSVCPERGDLRFTAGEWAAFIAGVGNGEF